MPRRRLAPCAHPGCPELTSSTRCPKHAPPDRRPPASQRGYGHDWRKRRARYLRRHPNCVACGAPATDVDHIIPRADLERTPGVDPDDDRWLQSLCHSCHSRKTAAQDGSFGRAIDYDRTLPPG